MAIACDGQLSSYNAHCEFGGTSMLSAWMVGACVLMLLAGDVFAQEHEHASGEKLGVVHFATSCNGAAQKEVDRAVALLHSFQFSRAIQGFNATLKDDPTCGIAYWGIALSQWSNPFAAGMKDTSQLKAGRASVELGETTSEKTEREREYIAAVGRLYADFENTPQSARLLAYRDAMSALAAKYPTDSEAQIFYALAIAASEDPADKSYAGRLKAGAILENLFKEEPNHPGLRTTLFIPTTFLHWPHVRWTRRGVIPKLRRTRRMLCICLRIHSRARAIGRIQSTAT